MLLYGHSYCEIAVACQNGQINRRAAFNFKRHVTPTVMLLKLPCNLIWWYCENLHISWTEYKMLQPLQWVNSNCLFTSCTVFLSFGKRKDGELELSGERL